MINQTDQVWRIIQVICNLIVLSRSFESNGNYDEMGFSRH